MGLWNYDRKGRHDREAGSSSGRRRGSVKKEEPASSSPPRRAPALPAFSIAPTSAGERDRHYVRASVCRRYWETRTPLPWSDAHLPNNWHLSADRVPIPPVPTSGRARDEEIECRRRLLPDDLFYNARYAPDSPLRASFFTGTSTGPQRPRERAQERGRRRVCGVMPTPSPSPSPPPPPRMTDEEEARLLQRVMDDSMNTHDERQWDGLEEAMALSAVAAAFQPLLGQGWGWSCTAPGMAAGVGVNWCPTPPRSPEREASPREEVVQPREEVVQAPPAVQPAPVHHTPPAHLWTPPEYVDLVSDDDDTGGQ
ncbi:hypothetical protein VPH35_046557 [Triticum aestivum]